MFENLGETLRKKLGPFPVWVWGVILGLGVIVWYWFGVGGVTSGTGEEEAPDDFAGDLPPSGDFSTPTIVPPSDGVIDEATNREWLSQAVRIAGTGGASLVAVQRALEKYLNNESLTQEEQTYVNRAIAGLGLPPEGGFGVGELEPPDETPASRAWNPATRTELKVTQKARMHRPVVIRVAVRWVEPQGRIIRPFGEVLLYQDGQHFRTLRLINGDAVTTMTLWAANKATADKRIVWTAKYRPTGNHTGGAVSRASGASPQVTVIA